MSRRRGPKGKGRSQKGRSQSRSPERNQNRSPDRNNKGTGKARSLLSQAQHIIRMGKHYGESKSVAKDQGKSQGRVYAEDTFKNYKSFILMMVRDVHRHHPEVKYIYDIKPEHVQDFLDRNANRWNEVTAGNHQSDLEKFVLNAREVHKNSPNMQKWSVGRDSGVSVYGLKGKGQIPVAVSERDLQKIIQNMSINTPVTRAPEVIAAIGCRVDECRNIEPRFIILPERPGPGNYGYVHLEETKNGRPRNVTIKTREDHEMFKELKERAERNEWQTIWANRSTRCIQDNINKAMVKAGIKEKYTGVCAHGIRKNYAKRDFNERRQAGRSEKSAWGATQDQMGHSGSHRQNLFDRYAGAEEG